MGRAPCCDKANVKRGPWSPEEDSKLKDYIVKHGNGGNWIALPQKAGLKRCGKSCRLRWLNYLRPNIKHGEFSDAEDRLICGMFATIGSRWSIIAAQLPGRTDNDIKNYWNTKLRKKLMGSTTTSSSSSPFMVPSNHHPHYPTGSSKLSSNPFSAIQNMNHEQLLNPSFITSTTIPDQSNSNHLLLNYNYNPHGLGPNNNHQPLEALVSHSINGLMFGGVSHHDQASSSSDGSYSQISHGNYKICCDDGGVQMNQEESNQVGFITNGYGNGSEINHQSNKFMLDFGSSKAIDGGDHNYLIGATATWNNDDTDHQKPNGYFGHNNNNVIATTTTSSNTPLEYDSLEEVKKLIRVTNNPLLLLNAENKTKEGEEEEEEERMRRHMYYY